MPTYEYECRECGTKWEQELPMDERDDPIYEMCLECLSHSIYRLVSTGTSFILKGTCWGSDGYSTYLGDSHKFLTGEKL